MQYSGGKMALTHPIASNIFKSSGSPESTPSIFVREWQVAMQATNSDFSKLSLQAFSSGKRKLKQWSNNILSTIIIYYEPLQKVCLD